MIWKQYRITRIIWSIIVVLMSCIITTSTSDALDTPLLINCGLPKSTPSVSPFDGRVWQSDDNPAFAPTNLNTVSTVGTADADDLPYQTARVFWSDITYTFSISTRGPKFIRLYFFPNVSYNNTNLPHQFSTSVFANSFTLLQNFNPFVNSQGKPFIIYEFQIIIQNGENNLNLTFSPGATNRNNTKSSYGYVNGIEIQSIPDGLYINGSNLNYFYVLEPEMSYTLQEESTAFQTAYRLNVGGETVEENEDDPGGMKRTWEADDAYLVGDYSGAKMEPWSGDDIRVNYTQKTPDYVAPKAVYASARDMRDKAAIGILIKNLTWTFNVDPGFDYVVRLHFCLLDKSINMAGQNFMSVYIGGLLAVLHLDIWAEAGGLNIPVYKDYVITAPVTSNGSKVALSLTLFPQLAFIIDASLNGLEILKLSSTTRNLAVPNPAHTNSLNPAHTNSLNQTPSDKSSIHKILILIAGVFGGLLLVSIILLALFRRRLQYKKLLDLAWIDDAKFLLVV